MRGPQFRISGATRVATFKATTQVGHLQCLCGAMILILRHRVWYWRCDLRFIIVWDTSVNQDALQPFPRDVVSHYKTVAQTST